LGSSVTIVGVNAIGHDILAASVALMTVAVFVAMIWAGRVH
jgi:hypothetical protein